MSAAAREEALVQEPSVNSMQLAVRLAVVIDNMRAEGRFNLETWLNAVENGMGGTVVVKAPCISQKRAVPEARYVSEGISVSAQGTMFEQS